MRRSDICLYPGPADRAELEALIINRNTPRKLVWWSGIVLATTGGHGTFEIMRRTGMPKPTFWRWQARYLDEGMAGLKRDKTRPSRVPPLPMETRLKVIAKTVREDALHPALQAPLRAQQRVLAEPGGTVLRRDHVKAHPARHLFQRH